MDVQVATVLNLHVFTGRPPMDYEYVFKELLSSEVRQVFTTIKTKQQSDENMIGIIRARTRKATVLPREFGQSTGIMLPSTCRGKHSDPHRPQKLCARLLMLA